ncbi:MAG: hypothetical protein ACXABK_03240, partial [Candidatus Heimdallarchaeaceae archaeon]
MNQENKRTLDELMENTTVLLETIVSDVVHSAEKIYASFPPGDMSSSLFVFSNENFLEDFVFNFDLIRESLQKNIASLPYERSDEILILANLLLEIKEYDLATEIYETLTKYEPDNRFAWSNLMTINILLKNNEKAMNCYLHLPPDFLEHVANEKKDSS